MGDGLRHETHGPSGWRAVNIWNHYLYGRVAAIRPYLLFKGFLILLALDLWFSVPRSHAYGVGGFNAAHFRWLDAMQPVPTPAVYGGVLLLSGLVAMVLFLSGMNRSLLALLFAVYTYGWAMSRLDGFQHHYFTTLVLGAFIFFPELRIHEIEAGRGRDTCAWAFVLVGVLTALVYGYAAFSKLDAEWRSGQTLKYVAGTKPLFTTAAALVSGFGVNDHRFWKIVGHATIGTELAIAIGYLLSLHPNRFGSRPIRI